uniref:G_PROTEIN_RECEP_F1_2 domain-containing protein n=1 Tax=Steinernema glaseri TaxID=37863 RepID=A0A1I7YD35_9BILA
MDGALRRSGRIWRGDGLQLASLLFVGLAVVPASQFLFYVLYHPVVTPCDERWTIPLFGDLVFEVGDYLKGY